MSQTWSASMPSNIALIKYMGKKDVEKNIPTNASISWTLDHLTTQVRITKKESGDDEWQALPSDYPFEMSETGLKKFLGHFKRIKEVYGVTDTFVIASANNFPADCGIASSASSFAALTEAACVAFEDLTDKKLSVVERAQLSARGSGSSCRSFLPGLVQWTEEEISEVQSDLKDLHHMVILVGAGAKKVSSSEAHKMVKTSPLFNGRVERSENRLSLLKQQIAPLEWKALYENVWAEFWDMHSLFETSQPPFGYFLPGTLQVIETLREFWDNEKDGPLVTMDAGPNLHLLWRKDQKELAVKYFETYVKAKWTCLSNIEEVGFAKF